MNSRSSQIKVQLVLPHEKLGFKTRLKGFWQLIRADKPLGILLLLWPVLWGLWIAGEGNPNWYVTLVFILGTILMRSAGCALDDYADRRIDGKLVRTCHRPIAMGIIKPKEALAVFALLSMAAFLLVLTLNLATVVMSVVALLLAVIYPFTKRYTHWQQAFLGFAYAWAVPMAFTAIQETVQPVTWVLYAATVLWVMVYDTEQAMIYRDDDEKAGVKSTAILLGGFDVYMLGVWQLSMLGLLIWAGQMTGRSWFYFIAIALTLVFFVRQQYMMYLDKQAGAFAAYLNNNCFGMTVFLILLMDYFITA